MTDRAPWATLLGFAVLLSGCPARPGDPATTVVTVSDIHFDPFTDPSLVPDLEASPVSAWPAIFARSGTTDPGQYGHTTNHVLLRRMADALRAQDPRPVLVVFGGDLLVQDFATAYSLVTHTQDEAAMKAFALKTVTYVVRQVREALAATPVYFTLGNWDDYAGSFGLQPDDPFLADTADLFLDELLLGTADPLEFDRTYRSGGYYAANVPGTDLVVLGLNTLFLAPQAPAGIEAAVTEELDWLELALASVEASGRRAWIVMHVPPGGDLATTGGDVDPQGHVAQPTMLLQAGPQGRLIAILAARRSSVAAVFTGHTHMDEYRLAEVAMQGLPGITSLMGNAPAFKTFTVGAGCTLLDYVSWNLDLSAPSASFQPWYGFSAAYGLADPLGPSLAALYPQLMTSPSAQSGYQGRYGSGHAPEKAITPLNWPVYWCGIAFMGSQGLADCVNQR